MADRELVTRTGKAASLNASDYDQNVNSMNGTVEEVTGATHTIAVTDQGKTIQYSDCCDYPYGCDYQGSDGCVS